MPPSPSDSSFDAAAPSFGAAAVDPAVDADLATWLPRRDPARRTRLLAILNLTPDSFHDGGVDRGDPAQAAERAERFVAEGADALDLGAESTRPGAAPVDADEEWRRLEPVLERVVGLGVPISVDTRRASVARRALAAGATIVNDVSGLTFDPQMAEVLGEAGAAAIVMHMRGTPGDMQRHARYDDVVVETIGRLGESVERAIRGGVSKRRVAIDPGLGFAKTADHNREILRRLGEFGRLGRPVLVGASRKSFLAETSGERAGAADTSARLEGTLATSVLALLGGATILRVHDVEANRRAVATAERILRVPA